MSNIKSVILAFVLLFAIGIMSSCHTTKCPTYSKFKSQVKVEKPQNI